MARKRTGYAKMKDGKLQYRFTYEGKRYAVYGNSYAECEDKYAVRIQEIKDKIYTKNRGITLTKYYPEWQLGRVGIIAESTRYTNDQRWARIEEIIGNEKIKNLETRQIRLVQQQLAKTLAITTVNDTMDLLRSVLAGAVRDRIINYNPSDDVKHLKNDATPASETYHRALTQDEQRLFFIYAKKSWCYHLFAFMVSTGLRIGEVGALTWKDIDYRNKVIHINKALKRISGSKIVVGNPKTKQSKRDIPLTDGIVEILKSQRDNNIVVPLDGRVFNRHNGEFVTKNQVNSEILKVLKDIESTEDIVIEKFTSHAFRDTFATRAIEQGMQMNTLKVLLGHSSLRMTMDLYAHVLPNTKQEEMQMLRIVI